MKRNIVLIVDDEPVITKTLVAILNRLDSEFVAVGSTSVREALTIVRAIRPDLVLLDVAMPGVTGLEHAVEMRDRCGCTVLLLSGQPHADSALQQLSEEGCQPFEILPKPVHPTALLEKIRDMIRAAHSGSRAKTVASSGSGDALPN